MTWLAEQQGHYGLRVPAASGNHPTLLAQVEALPWKAVPAHRVYTRAHGRSQAHTLLSTPCAHLADARSTGIAHLLAGIGQVIAITRTRAPLDGDRTRARKPVTATTETVYYVTSLTAAEADPVLLATWIRGHWCLEAIHFVRDVTFGEDASGVRVGGGPQVIAALRNVVIALRRLAGAGNIAAACRGHARDPQGSLLFLLAA